MKFDLNKISFVVTLIFLIISSYYSLKLSLKDFDSLKFDDKELDNMLNDPKFSSLTGELSKLKNSKAEMEKARAELKSMGVDVSKKEGEKVNEKAASDLLKDSGFGALSGGLDSFSLNLKEIEKPKKSSLGGGTDDILSKLGDFKDLGLDFGNSKININEIGDSSNKEANNNPEKEKSKQELSKPVIDEKFKNLDFLTKQQARLLLEILKQPVFYSMLPVDAQQIVKV